MLRKGVYPCEYMDDWEKFEENCLPPVEAFYNEACQELVSVTPEGLERVWDEEFGR